MPWVNCFYKINDENLIMQEGSDGFAVMARLTLSLLDKSSKDSSCWSQPTVHFALLVGGLSVLMSSIELVDQELNVQ